MANPVFNVSDQVQLCCSAKDGGQRFEPVDLRINYLITYSFHINAILSLAMISSFIPIIHNVPLRISDNATHIILLKSA